MLFPKSIGSFGNRGDIFAIIPPSTVGSGSDSFVVQSGTVAPFDVHRREHPNT